MVAIPYICFYILSISSIPYVSRLHLVQSVEAMEKSLYLAALFLIFWGWGLVGYDTNAYYSMYYAVPYLSHFDISAYEREYLFWLWCSIFRTLHFSYVDFRFVSSVVDIIVLFIFFSRFLDKKYFPIAFMFYLLYGVSCYLISLIYFSRKKYIRFILWNVAAFYFHISIIPLPLFTILYPLFLRRRLILCIFIIGCIFSISGIGLSFLFARFGESIPVVGFLIVRYVKSTYANAHGLTIGFLERFLSFIIIYKFQKRLIRDYKNTKVFISLFYVYIFFCFYFIDFKIILERIAAMFKISYWICFPLIFSYLKKKDKNIFFVILILYGGLKIFEQYNLDVYAFKYSLLK